MKRLQLIMMASIIVIAGATSCKTTQKIDMKHPQNSEVVSQVELKDLHPLSSEQLQGKWIITSAMGKSIVADESAHIILDVKSQRIYGNNGCNTFNGAIVMGEGCALSFTDCITTLIACSPDVTDGNVMQALGRTTYYNATLNSHEALTIDLLDSTGSSVATLSRDMHEILNGYWDIAEVDGMKIKLDEMPKIVLDIEEKKFTGNSGCNIMNGNIECNDNVLNNEISFTGVISTRRMCSPAEMEVEDKVLNVMNKITNFRILENNRVAFYGKDSQYAIMIIERK